MMNSETLIEDARFLAGRLMDENPDDREQQVRALYQRVLSRPPTEGETARSLEDLSVAGGELAAAFGKGELPGPQANGGRAGMRWRRWLTLCSTPPNSSISIDLGADQLVKPSRDRKEAVCDETPDRNKSGGPKTVRRAPR